MLYLKEMISCADLNKDGKISFEEFQKLMIEPFWNKIRKILNLHQYES